MRIYDKSLIQLIQRYSRDHRPDLNQAVLELIMQAASGNVADKKNIFRASTSTSNLDLIVKLALGKTIRKPWGTAVIISYYLYNKHYLPSASRLRTFTTSGSCSTEGKCSIRNLFQAGINSNDRTLGTGFSIAED